MRQSIVWLLCLPALARAVCFDPSPAFPVPQWEDGGKPLTSTFKLIEDKVHKLLADGKYDIYSTSIELTTAKETIWSYYHTARKRNETRLGTAKVDTNSQYRIASITKTFTTLAILKLQKTGNLSLDDPVNKYLPRLSGELPWKDVTLRTLASQLSGIPREFAESDVLTLIDDPVKYGLPPASKDGLPRCDSYSNYTVPCTEDDFYDRLSKLKPVFAPNQRSTYSNVGFELLGLVLENVTGHNYTAYVTNTIFESLNLTSTTLIKPESDEHAVLPLVPGMFWDVVESVRGATGGVYSSASDMSKYLRYILTHYNTLATGVNWFMPGSYSGGFGSFYGMPWEIFRSDRVLRDSRRPVTFTTKGGSLPGYYSKITILEEYGLGLTVLVGGEPDLLGGLQEAILPMIVQGAEDAIWANVQQAYAGRYTATNDQLNSSLTITADAKNGVALTSFISNGTNVFESGLAGAVAESLGSGTSWRTQLTPTLLFKNETAQQGEIWYVLVLPKDRPSSSRIFGDSCHFTIDTLLYAGKPLLQIVFWRSDNLLELPAWNVTLKLDKLENATTQFVVQP